MELFPAIDLYGGRAVRLVQGDYDRATFYGDPLKTAREFARQGAKNLHLVDLDGAKDGAPANFETIRQIAQSCDLFLEVGGGIRTEEDLQRCLQAGAGRVILGTAAVTDPDFLRRMLDRWGPRVAVGVDARGGRVATHGWRQTSGLDSFDFCRRLRDWGVGAVIYTDIARDGQLAGTNLPAYQRLAGIDGLDIIASGGISSCEELTRLRELGVAGAILGKALYEGKLDLPGALRAAAEQTGGAEADAPAQPQQTDRPCKEEACR